MILDQKQLTIPDFSRFNNDLSTNFSSLNVTISTIKPENDQKIQEVYLTHRLSSDQNLPLRYKNFFLEVTPLGGDVDHFNQETKLYLLTAQENKTLPTLIVTMQSRYLTLKVSQQAPHIQFVLYFQTENFLISQTHILQANDGLQSEEISYQAIHTDLKLILNIGQIIRKQSSLEDDNYHLIATVSNRSHHYRPHGIAGSSFAIESSYAIQADRPFYFGLMPFIKATNPFLPYYPTHTTADGGGIIPNIKTSRNKQLAQLKVKVNETLTVNKSLWFDSECYDFFKKNQKVFCKLINIAPPTLHYPDASGLTEEVPQELPTIDMK